MNENKRIKKFLEKLLLTGCDSFLVSDSDNIAYLTGYKLAGSYLLITPEKLVCFTSFLFMKEAKKIKIWQVLISTDEKNVFDLIVSKSTKLKLKSIGFESKKLPFLEYKTIVDRLAGYCIEFKPVDGLIESLRIIKDKSEINLIKKSIQISKEAFNFAKEIMDSAMTEKDLSIEIEKFLKLKGDNAIAFETIVASGANTAFPHHLPGDTKLDNKFVLIDLGSKYYGYCADLTRMFFWSKMPPLLKKIHTTVKKAQELSIKKIKDGIKASIVDKAAREFIEKKGWGKYFGHGVGHGLGRAVHEAPYIGPKSHEILKEGMVVTIEPAIYLNNKFGVRIEDIVLVGAKRGEILSGDVNR